MAKSQADYDALVKERMKRYHGDRDAAVRSANIAAGYGNSTALRKPKAATAVPGKSGGGGGGGKKKSGSPYKLPSRAPTPTARPTNFSPDLAPSPNPYDPNSPVGPGPQGQRTMPQAPFEPGGGAPPNLGLPPFKPGLGKLYMPPGDLAPPQSQNPPMNPALSQASVLASTPPELRVDPVAKMLQGMKAGGGGGNPAFPFKVEPYDPNEGWLRAMFRG